jgi:hypothetical protein
MSLDQASGWDDEIVHGLAAPPLSVQTILYGHSQADLDRFVRGLAAAVRVAQRNGSLGSVGIAIGDCSPEPVLDNDRVSSLEEQLGDLGIRRFAYRFFGENLGSAGGHNALFEAFGGELVLIVNPDVYALPGLLCPLLERIGEPGAGIVEARQVPLEHPKAFDHDTGDTSWASTACALVHGDVISSLGGFDAQSFFLYCDDVDFSWRARLAGRRVIYEPTACVFHDKRLDRDGQVQAGDAEVYYSAEAALMMAWKYSRPDLVDTWSEGLLTTGLPSHTRAVETFRQRQAIGQLPEQLDAEGDVAQFVGYAYARHRFAYDDD